MERAIKPKQGGTELIKHPESEKGRVGVSLSIRAGFLEEDDRARP